MSGNLLDLVNEVQLHVHVAEDTKDLLGINGANRQVLPTSTCAHLRPAARTLELDTPASSEPSSGVTMILRAFSASSMRTRPADFGDRRNTLREYEPRRVRQRGEDRA